MEKMIQSQWRLNSYSYHENTIFPIALREVKVTNQGVELIVNCIVKDADTVGLANWRGCAEGFVSIPLLFMGCPLSLTNNIYKLNGLMMDIYMESGVFNNLVGNFSNSDLFIDFNNKTKMVRELKSWNTSAVMGTMRKVEK
jgi:hypothetical protein